MIMKKSKSTDEYNADYQSFVADIWSEVIIIISF